MQTDNYVGWVYYFLGVAFLAFFLGAILTPVAILGTFAVGFFVAALIYTA